MGEGHKPGDCFVDWQKVQGDNPWNPQFLKDIAIYKSLRFMDWDNANNSGRTRWAERSRQNNPKQNPVAYEWMMDLCNRMNADLWVTVPHKTITRNTGDEPSDCALRLCLLVKTGVDMKEVDLKPLLDRLAKMTAEELIAAGGQKTGEPLKPNLKLHVEYSNETWNGVFQQSHYCWDEGTALGLDKNRWTAGFRFHAWAAVRLFRAANLVFGADSKRLVRVLATHTANSWIAGQHLEVVKDPKYNPWQVKADAIAAAPHHLQNTHMALPLVGAAHAAAPEKPLTLSVSTNVLSEVRGWGLMPAPFDRKLPTYADGNPAHGDAGWRPETGAEPNAVHRAVCSLGFTVARAYLPPSLGKPDGSLDEARLQDLKDHLTILARGGVTNYVINMWTPPAHMKTPDRVRYGEYQDRVQRLDPAYADGEGNDLADYLAAVLVRLREAGFPPPSGVSIQNEPDVSPIYDGCLYADTPEAQELYRRVMKQLRAKMDAAGFRGVPVLATESSGAANLEALFGKASPNGFERLHSDPQLEAALGGFAWHQYYTVDHVRTFRAAMAAHGAPRWMTEVAQDATPMRGDEMPATDNEGLKITINMLRRMAADFTDFRVNYWFFWRGWHSTGGKSYPAQDLVFGDAHRAEFTQLGQVLRQIWTTVRPGWRVVAVQSSDPERLRADNEDIIGGHEPNGNMMSRGTDVLVFASPAHDRHLVLLVNRWKEPRTVTRLDGLAGARADLWLTTASDTLIPLPGRPVKAGVLVGDALTLPPLSVMLLMTQPAN